LGCDEREAAPSVAGRMNFGREEKKPQSFERTFGPVVLWLEDLIDLVAEGQRTRGPDKYQRIQLRFN
jgi:hypothetical protein